MHVSPESVGSVKVNGIDYSVQLSFEQNTVVTLEAVPAEGYQFASWTGSLSGNTNPVELTMNCSKIVTANFLTLSNLNSIGNFVWKDIDADGIQDSGEVGIDGVTVKLYDLENNLVDTKITSGGGFYNFSDLEPGKYYLEFIDYSGNYVFSPANQGSNDRIDSDTDLTGRTNIVNLYNGKMDMTCDAGLYRPSTLTYTIRLSSGWNLISLPLIPDITDPTAAFAGVDFGTVYQYRHPDGPTPTGWVWYVNGGTPQNGFKWGEETGYWISRGSPADNLVFDGEELNSNTILPINYYVYDKWNLIGFKSTTPKLPSEYLASIEGKYAMIYGYKDGSFFIVGTEGHELMQPGQGYWIYILEPGTISPPIEQIISNITTEEAYDMMNGYPDNSGLVILDVRTQSEYDSGHIENAVHLDYYSATFDEDLGNLCKTYTYIVYCRSGTRSGWALDLMENLGFRKVYNMEGGILQWIADGYELAS